MITGLNPQVSTLVDQLSPKSDVKSKKIEKSEVIENDRVSILAEQIKNGTYKVDVSKMAEAVAEELSH